MSDTGVSARIARRMNAQTANRDMSDIRFASLHGHRVAYRDEGDRAAEPLLLIHGMAGSSRAWVPVIGPLSAKYRVIAPDLLGHGRVRQAPHRLLAGRVRGVVARFPRRARRPRRPRSSDTRSAAGSHCSSPTSTAQYCRRLVLVNSGGLGTDISMPLRLLSTPGAELLLPVLASRPAMFVGNGVRSLLAARGAESLQSAGALAEVFGAGGIRWSARPFCGRCARWSTFAGQTVCALDRLPRLVGDLPTLIVAGARDAVIPADHAQAAHAVLPGSRLEIIDDAGHHPQLDCPEALAQLIDEFVSSDDRPATSRSRGRRLGRRSGEAVAST